MGKKAQTIGYKYFLGAHMIVCLSPEHDPVEAVTAIEVGERVAWAGNVTESQQVYVNAPNLFGGEKKEGGVQGPVDFMFGEPDQGVNDYLVSHLGTPMPAFRGVLGFVLRKCLVTAMSPYPKPWAFRVLRTPARSWYPETANINSGSANPVHVIYEALTSEEWGMGYPTDAIDVDSFTEAADTCFEEALGVSFQMTKQDSIESFVYTVLGHCNGMIYTRPTDGKFSIKLLREDYDPETLDVFDESNITTLDSYERPGYAEMVNEIIVAFRPRGTSQDDTVTVQDLAAIQAQLGVVSQTVQYPGIDTRENAAKLALRDLRQKATPLARVKFRTNRKAWNKKLGEVIAFSWAEHEVVRLPIRILGLNYGSLTSGEITVDGIEDIFGLPDSTYMGEQPPIWEDPTQDPAPLTVRRVEETSYWDAQQNLPPAELDKLDPTAASVTAVMGEVPAYLQSFELWTKPDGGAYAFDVSGEFAAHAILTDALTRETTAFNLNSLSSSVSEIPLGTLIGINGELMHT